MVTRFSLTLLASACFLFPTAVTNADPCGMVPPIYTGQEVPIKRVGHQQTYVFFKDGVETFVIRPGFSGKVDEFGMLIPFPKPPALRKVPDNIFSQLAAAVDPPEVVINLNPVPPPAARAPVADAAAPARGRLAYNEVRVVKKEAVGMYEVVVLEAGSSAALKRWMKEHKYKYPTGMDKVCDEYVADGWCFVAVKTKVGKKGGVDPRPGQRSVDSKLPDGSTFDGNVQGMGFRFQTDKLVVPMRLSAYNEGKLRNIVYLLSDGPKRIKSIPEEYVVRQLSGEQLLKNVTEPLPVRILGGSSLEDVPKYRQEWLKKARDPEPKNGAAKELFASDLLAVSSGELSLAHEEKEKELLRIGEHLGLRGPGIDKLNGEALSDLRKETVNKAIDELKGMTLTLVDGDFPRDVIGSQNLVFAEYRMPARRNKTEVYDAKEKGPAKKKPGVIRTGQLDVSPQPGREQIAARPEAPSRPLWLLGGMILSVLLLVAIRRQGYRRQGYRRQG